MSATHVIFDMDGTLTDTARVTFEACGKTTKEFGIPPIEKEALREAMGIPGLAYFRRVLPDLDAVTLEKFARRTDEEECAAIRRVGKAILFDGVEELLGKLKDSGVKLFIASTGSLEHVNTTVDAAGIRKYFRGIYCDHPNKDETIERMPERAEGGKWLMVGDKDIDANAAKHNGIFSVGAGFGYCGPAEGVFFDKVVSTTAELFEFIRVEGFNTPPPGAAKSDQRSAY